MKNLVTTPRSISDLLVIPETYQTGEAFCKTVHAVDDWAYKTCAT